MPGSPSPGSKALEKLTFLGRGHTTFSMDLTTALPTASRMALKLPLKAARAKREQLESPRPTWARSWTRAMRAAAPWEGQCPSHMDDVALLIHTGGTTGVPKAAALTHANLRANVEESIAWVPVLHEGAEVFYCILPLFHAFGFTIGFLAGLRLGATVAMFPKFDTALVLAAQRRLPCTFFLGVPPMYERLLTAAEGTDVDLSSIHFSLSGAMPLSAPLAQKWEEATGGLMIEGYGMTEASPILLGSPLASSRARGALGIPFPSTQVRIVDSEDPGRDVEEGAVGELIARGPQVFSGYWNQDDETAEVFTADGWLRTGDLVQVRDGFIYMADRRKEMINSSGFNVYPSQVEEAVRSMPGIADVAAVGVPAGESGEDVVAAVVLEVGRVRHAHRPTPVGRKVFSALRPAPTARRYDGATSLSAGQSHAQAGTRADRGGSRSDFRGRGGGPRSGVRGRGGGPRSGVRGRGGGPRIRV